MKVIPLPAAGNFAGIVLEPGEHLIVKSHHLLKYEEAERMRRMFESHLPDVKIVILCGDLDLYAVATSPEKSMLLSTELAPEVTATRDAGREAIERRCFGVTDLRVVREEGQPPKITGYAATFNQPSKVLRTESGKKFKEQINPGAFKDALGDGRDLLALVGHKASEIVARRSAGKVDLAEDDKGLKFSVEPPDTTRAHDLMNDIDHGNIKGMSFGMGDDNVADWTRGDDGLPLRTLKKIDLKEISFTPVPAYEGTTCAVRSVERDIEKLDKATPADATTQTRATMEVEDNSLVYVCRDLADYCRMAFKSAQRANDCMASINGDLSDQDRTAMDDCLDDIDDTIAKLRRTKAALVALGAVDESEDDDEAGDDESDGERQAQTDVSAVRTEQLARYAGDVRAAGLSINELADVFGTRKEEAAK